MSGESEDQNEEAEVKRELQKLDGEGGPRYEMTVKVKRGSETRDQETLKGKTRANTIEDLEYQTGCLVELIEEKASQVRDIDPRRTYGDDE